MLPHTSISISEVREEIGAGTNRLGELCRHPNVNMFSKYKPVPYPAEVTDNHPEWWKASDGSCGINIPRISTLNDVVNQTWTRRLPEGGSNSPFRLGDFREYEHYADPIISRSLVSYSINTFFTNSLNFYFSTDGGEILLEDITNMPWNRLYLTAQICNNTGSVLKTCQATAPLSDYDAGSFIPANLSSLPHATYIVYFFMATRDLSERYALYRQSGLPNPATLSKTLFMPLSLKNIAFSYNRSGSFKGIEEVDNIDYTPRYQLHTIGTLAIQCNFYNSESQGFSVSASDFKMECEGIQDGIGQQTPRIYRNSSQVSSVYIGGKNSVTVILEAPEIFLLDGSQQFIPSKGSYWANVSLLYKNNYLLSCEIPVLYDGTTRWTNL